MLISAIKVETVVCYCIAQMPNNVANSLLIFHLKLIR